MTAVQTPPDKSAMMVTLVQTPAKQTTLQDVVLGSLGVAGVLLVLSLVLGLGLSLVRLLWLRLHPPEADHLPPVSPLASGSAVRPSSQAR